MDGGAIVAEGEPGAMLASERLGAVFGIERVDGQWRPRPIAKKVDAGSSPA